MSIALAQFYPQLILKLTLGQQFKQIPPVPDELKAYVPEQIEQAQDILQLNQAWVLLQQAGQQAQSLNLQQLAPLGKTEPEIFLPMPWIKFIEKLLDSNELDQQEVSQICEALFLQYVDGQQRIPAHLVMRLLSLLDTATLAKVLPERAYQLLQFEKNSEIKKAAIYRDYVQQGDAQAFIQALQGLSKNVSRSLLISLMLDRPDLFVQAIAEQWKKMRKGVSLQAAELFLNVPLPLFDLAYQTLQQLPELEHNLKFVQFHQLQALYLYQQHSDFAQDALRCFQQAVMWDAQQKLLLLDIDLDREDQLLEFELISSAMSGATRAEFKAALEKAELKQKFLKQQAQSAYMLDLLSHAPLAFWKSLFSDWSEILTIRHQAQKNVVLDALAIRCGAEQEVELANWLYPHVKSAMKKQLYVYGEGLKYLRLLQPAHYWDFVETQVEQQLLKQSYAGFIYLLHAMPSHFKYQFKHQHRLTEHVMAAIRLSTEDIAQMKSDAQRNHIYVITEWMMVYGYPIDFTKYQEFISPMRSRILQAMLHPKQQLQTSSL